MARGIPVVYWRFMTWKSEMLLLGRESGILVWGAGVIGVIGAARPFAWQTVDTGCSGFNV